MTRPLDEVAARKVSDVLTNLSHQLVEEGEGEGHSGGNAAFRGPNSTSIKHFCQSVKDGRLVSFYTADLDEITGYIAGWDDLRQPSPRVFIVVPPLKDKDENGEFVEPERWLVPFYNVPVRLHSKSTAPRREGDYFYEKYEEIVRPFKTHVMHNYYGKARKGEATPLRKVTG